MHSILCTVLHLHTIDTTSMKKTFVELSHLLFRDSFVKRLDIISHHIRSVGTVFYEITNRRWKRKSDPYLLTDMYIRSPLIATFPKKKSCYRLLRVWDGMTNTSFLFLYLTKKATAVFDSTLYYTQLYNDPLCTYNTNILSLVPSLTIHLLPVFYT